MKANNNMVPVTATPAIISARVLPAGHRPQYSQSLQQVVNQSRMLTPASMPSASFQQPVSLATITRLQPEPAFERPMPVATQPLAPLTQPTPPRALQHAAPATSLARNLAGPPFQRSLIASPWVRHLQPLSDPRFQPAPVVARPVIPSPWSYLSPDPVFVSPRPFMAMEQRTATPHYHAATAHSSSQRPEAMQQEQTPAAAGDSDQPQALTVKAPVTSLVQDITLWHQQQGMAVTRETMVDALQQIAHDLPNIIEQEISGGKKTTTITMANDWMQHTTESVSERIRALKTSNTTFKLDKLGEAKKSIEKLQTSLAAMPPTNTALREKKQQLLTRMKMRYADQLRNMFPQYADVTRLTEGNNPTPLDNLITACRTRTILFAAESSPSPSLQSQPSPSPLADLSLSPQQFGEMSFIPDVRASTPIDALDGIAPSQAPEFSSAPSPIISDGASSSFELPSPPILVPASPDRDPSSFELSSSLPQPSPPQLIPMSPYPAPSGAELSSSPIPALTTRIYEINLDEQTLLAKGQSRPLPPSPSPPPPSPLRFGNQIPRPWAPSPESAELPRMLPYESSTVLHIPLDAQTPSPVGQPRSQPATPPQFSPSAFGNAPPTPLTPSPAGSPRVLPWHTSHAINIPLDAQTPSPAGQTSQRSSPSTYTLVSTPSTPSTPPPDSPPSSPAIIPEEHPPESAVVARQAAPVTRSQSARPSFDAARPFEPYLLLWNEMVNEVKKFGFNPPEDRLQQFAIFNRLDPARWARLARYDGLTTQGGQMLQQWQGKASGYVTEEWKMEMKDEFFRHWSAKKDKQENWQVAVSSAQRQHAPLAVSTAASRRAQQDIVLPDAPHLSWLANHINGSGTWADPRAEAIPALIVRTRMFRQAGTLLVIANEDNSVRRIFDPAVNGEIELQDLMINQRNAHLPVAVIQYTGGNHYNAWQSPGENMRFYADNLRRARTVFIDTVNSIGQSRPIRHSGHCLSEAAAAALCARENAALTDDNAIAEAGIQLRMQIREVIRDLPDDNPVLLAGLEEHIAEQIAAANDQTAEHHYHR